MPTCRTTRRWRAGSAPRASGSAAPSTCSSATACRWCSGSSSPTSPVEEEDALAELEKLQRADFEGIFEAMDGLPVTIRLLDPPLHEFLPDVEELLVRDAKGELDAEGRRLLAVAQLWREANPMLGTRGCRLGIIKPGLYRMQAKAIIEAAAARKAAGGDPHVEIMIPLIVTRAELALLDDWVREVASDGLSDGGRHATSTTSSAR